MLSLTASFRIKEGKEAEAVEQLKSMANAVKENESGALAYIAHRSQDDPMRVVFYEIYADKDALQTHRATDHMKRMNEVFAELFEGPVEIERLDRVEGFTRGD